MLTKCEVRNRTYVNCLTGGAGVDSMSGALGRDDLPVNWQTCISKDGSGPQGGALSFHLGNQLVHTHFIARLGQVQDCTALALPN